MDNLFVPYEIAMELKSKGFNEECFAYYIFANNKKDLYYIIPYEMGSSNNDPCKGDCSAPTHQQVLNWFREEHNIDIKVSNVDNKLDKWMYNISNLILSEENNLDYDSSYDKLYYPSYYEALNKAIEEALKLIETQNGSTKW